MPLLTLALALTLALTLMVTGPLSLREDPFYILVPSGQGPSTFLSSISKSKPHHQEWYTKYGDPELVTWDELFVHFIWQKHHPTTDFGVWCTDMLSSQVHRIVAKVQEYHVKWEDRLCKYDHNPHFPYLITHFTDSMPVASIGGALSNMLWNPKYANNVFKVTVAVDDLGNIVYICPLAPRCHALGPCGARFSQGAIHAL